MPITVLLADDSENVRKAIIRLLQSDPEIQLVAEAVSFSETMQLATKLQPQVVVMDIHMKDENEVAPSKVKLCLAGSRLVAISIWNDQETKACADGFGAVTLLDKGNLWTELIPAIRRYASYSGR